MLFYGLYALIGFVVGAYFGFNKIAAVIFAAALIIILISKKRGDWFLSLFVCCVFVLCGSTAVSLRNRASCYTNQFVTVSGRISEIPYKINNIWRYTLECEELKFGEKTEKFSKRICVYSENEYEYSESISADGFLELFDEAKNPGCFNAYTYYKSIGIDYKMTALEDRRTEEKYYSNSLYANAVKIRNGICRRLDTAFKPDDAAILKYMLAGYRGEIDRDYTNGLVKSGVSRSLYSSYIHLLMIFAVSGLLTRFMTINKRRIIVCLMCVIYLCINPYSLSGRKLFLYTICMELLKARGVAVRPLDVLWLAILICGIQNPFVLYNEGFLMSCAATVFITVFYEKIYTRVSWINKNKGVASAGVLILISCVLILPVGAYLFDGISVYSVILSVLLIPVIMTVYILSPLMLCGSGTAKLIINNLTVFIRNLPCIIEGLPFSYLILPRPGTLLLMAYLLVLAALFKRKTRLGGVCAIAAAGLTLNFAAGEVRRVGKPEYSFISAGMGDCSILELPYKCTVMVDTGGCAEYMTAYDVGGMDIFPYLRHENIRSLDYVFISHYHSDHCGGFCSLADTVKIKNIFLPDCLPENENRVMIEEKAKEKGIKIHYIRETGVISLEEGISCEVLYFDKEAEDENDKSVVMRLESGEISCIYTGDITKNAEIRLAESGLDLKADILKTAHHGSKYSSCEEFLTAAAPKLAVAITDADNTYGFPAAETALNMEKANIKFLSTSEWGNITIKSGEDGLIWQRKIR